MIDALQPPGGLSGAGTVGGADLATTRGVTPPGGAGASAGVDFGAMLTSLASDAASTVRNAEAISMAGVQGRATVQQVVEAVMNAEHTLQGAVAIRDKVVAAYLEISRMQI